MIPRAVFASLLVLLAACSSTSDSKPAGDGGPSSSEAGPLDSTSLDTSADAPMRDASAHDGRPPDAGSLDTTAHDAPLEQGRPEVGAMDGGRPDANVLDTPSDQGLPDAGSIDGTVADGAGPSCDQLAHDPRLGTAQLATAYQVVDWATLPVTEWLPVALVDEASSAGGIGQVVYGYAGDGRVYRLGVWPNLAAPDAGNVAFDAVAAADRAYQIVTTPMLVTTGGRLLAGYRTLRGGAFLGGGVAVYDTAHPEAGASWIAATGVEGALGIGAYFLVGGDSLGSVANGRGVYGVETEGAKPLAGLVAKYPVLAGENVRPGLMAVTSNGVAVMGYYLDLAARHSLRLPEPSRLMEALSGGPAIELAQTPELTPADDVANLASFGQGVAVLHTRKVRGVLPALGRLEHYALSRAGGDAGTVVGAPAAILSAPDDDACTVVSQLVPVTGGMNLVVGLWDRNGQRLVRLAAR